MAQTLFDKLWQRHLVKQNKDGTSLIYIDRHLLHEVTSPQAFSGLKNALRTPWRINANYAVPDHNIPTTIDERENFKDKSAKLQLETLEQNCKSTDIHLFPLKSKAQGIVHVMGPEQGLCLPGMTIVCGDSHTSTHGAFATISMGIGTTDVEHVLATQTLRMKKYKNMQIKVNGKLKEGITAKDLILYVISKIGTNGATGFAIEYTGDAITNLSIEGRMTVCNMSIEAGARCGMIAVDNKTIEYFKDKPYAPKGEMWEKAVSYWQTLKSDTDAKFDKTFEFEAEDIIPQVSWGTSPEMTISVLDKVPDPALETDTTKRNNINNAMDYMGLKSSTAVTDIAPENIFIGSCTNGRIEDLRLVAKIVKDKKIAKNIKRALIVPGSGIVKEQAEKEGLADIFKEAGFEWREPGCSMCIAMNPDKLKEGERCASTSNRNFEGRQGKGSRTHLVSPAMAAACAINGHFVDVRKYL